MSSTITRTRPLWLKSRPRLQFRHLPSFTRSITAPVYPVRSHNTEEGLKIRAIPVNDGTSIMDSSPKAMQLQRTVITDSHPVGVVGIHLNRPNSLNAINHELLNTLHHQISTAVKDRSTRCIVLMGKGDSFCAGQDLKETMTKSGPASLSYETELRDALEKLQSITYLLTKSDAFVIAAVTGHAVGGGAEIALAADYIVGGEDTKFSFPEVKIGYIGTGGVTSRLTKMVGLMRAKELLLSGREVGGEEALGLGLMSELVSTGGPADVKGRAIELAKLISRMPSTSVSRTKRCVEAAADGMKMDDHLQLEVSSAIECSRQETAKNVFFKFRNSKLQAPPFMRFDPLRASTPMSGISMSRPGSFAEDPKAATIRFTNSRFRAYSSLTGRKIREMPNVAALMEKDMTSQERSDYTRWLWEQYEGKSLQDLDRVYSCFGLHSSFHSLNELLKVQLKMDFLAHSDNRRGDAFLPQMKALADTIKAMKANHFELGKEYLKLRGEMQYHPDGVDQSTLEKMDFVARVWDASWQRKWEYQRNVRTDASKLLCSGYEEFAQFEELEEFTPEKWRKATGRKKKKEDKGTDSQ